MNVLFLCGQYYPITGGTENQARLQASGLRALGCNVTVLTSRPRNSARAQIIDGVSVVRIRGLLYKSIRRWTVFLMFILYIIRHRSEIDIIHVHMADFHAAAAAIAGRCIRKKVVVKIASSGNQFDLIKLKRRYLFGSILSRFVLDHVDKFIAVSPEVMEDLLEFGVSKDRIVIIPNAVELRERFRSETKVKHNFVAVSRLIDTKNVKFLVRLAEVLGEEFRLIIIGEGPQRNEILALIKQLGLEEKVILVGRVTQQEVFEYLASSRIFLHPSSIEGMSNSLLEALSFGLIPIVNNIPSNYFILNDSLRRFAVPLNIDVWRKVILDVLNMDNFSCLESEIKRTIERFSANNISKEILTTYKDIT